MNDMAVEYKRRPFTVDEYHQLFERGLLHEDRDRVELIDGELVEMPPIGPDHVYRHADVTHDLASALSGRGFVLPMGSFPMGMHSEPQPDLAIIPASFVRSKASPYPPIEHFIAFIEIASTSFAYDSKTKMKLYARHGLPDYLLVDVGTNRLLVHRDPTPQGYATIESLGPDSHFSFTQIPEVTLSVDSFLSTNAKS